MESHAKATAEDVGNAGVAADAGCIVESCGFAKAANGAAAEEETICDLVDSRTAVLAAHELRVANLLTQHDDKGRLGVTADAWIEPGNGEPDFAYDGVGDMRAVPSLAVAHAADV